MCFYSLINGIDDILTEIGLIVKNGELSYENNKQIVLFNVIMIVQTQTNGDLHGNLFGYFSNK